MTLRLTPWDWLIVLWLIRLGQEAVTAEASQRALTLADEPPIDCRVPIRPGGLPERCGPTSPLRNETSVQA